MWQITLDLIGGIGSMLQDIIDTIRLGHNSFFNSSSTLNIAKFAIALVSIVYDLVFIVQYF